MNRNTLKVNLVAVLFALYLHLIEFYGFSLPNRVLDDIITKNPETVNMTKFEHLYLIAVLPLFDFVLTIKFSL